MEITETATISSVQANEGIPDKWKPFFRVEPLGLAPRARLLLQEIWDAINFLAPKIYLDRSAVIVVGVPPFCVGLKSGMFTFCPNADTIHSYMENLIFIDIQRLAGLNARERQVTIMEELVHVYLRVMDEHFVMHVVAAFCANVEVKDGQYIFR